MGELAEAGCVAFSQADAPLPDTQMLLRAMQYAGDVRPSRLAAARRTPHLARGGVAHDGEVATNSLAMRLLSLKMSLRVSQILPSVPVRSAGRRTEKSPSRKAMRALSKALVSRERGSAWVFTTDSLSNYNRVFTCRRPTWYTSRPGGLSALCRGRETARGWTACEDKGQHQAGWRFSDRGGSPKR